MKKFINKIALGVSALAAAFMLFSCEPAEEVPNVYEGNMISLDTYNGYFVDETAFKVYLAEEGLAGRPLAEYSYTYDENSLTLKLDKIYSISKADANACGAKIANSTDDVEEIMNSFTKDTPYTPSAYLSLIKTIEKSFNNAAPDVNDSHQRAAAITKLKKAAKKIVDGSTIKFDAGENGALTANAGDGKALALVDGVLFVAKSSELTEDETFSGNLTVTEVTESGSGSTGGNTDPGTDPDPSSGTGD